MPCLPPPIQSEYLSCAAAGTSHTFAQSGHCPCQRGHCYCSLWLVSPGLGSACSRMHYYAVASGTMQGPHVACFRLNSLLPLWKKLCPCVLTLRWHTRCSFVSAVSLPELCTQRLSPLLSAANNACCDHLLISTSTFLIVLEKKVWFGCIWTYNYVSLNIFIWLVYVCVCVCLSVCVGTMWRQSLWCQKKLVDLPELEPQRT